MAARGGPPDPTAEEKLPHPIIQSVPKLHKTIRHPGKARLPHLYWTPPAEAPMHRRPLHQSRAQAHAPTHAPGGTPTRTQAPRPSRNPNPEAERPQIPTPPPRTNSGTVRPPGWQPTSAGTGIPSSAACRHQRNSIQSLQYPIQAKVAAPAPNPPRNPPPGNPQMPQAHIATPRQPQKPQPDRIGTPTHTRWWSWSKEPREIDLMCQQKLFQG